LLPKGQGVNATLAGVGGSDNASVKPLVKHILSKELQLYFDKVCAALLDQANEDDRIAALASLRSDPGLHQLVPYFVQFVAEKVTHNLKDLFILTQMMQLASAMLDNKSLQVDPYIASIIPPILTCLVSPRLGSSVNRLEHYPLRSLAATLLATISRKYAKSSHTLKPRLVRTCLKYFLDPNKSLPVHFGAVQGIQAAGGSEAVKVLILPNLKEYGNLLQDAIAAGPPKKEDAEMVIGAIIGTLASLEEEGNRLVNGHGGGDAEEQRSRLGDRIGELLASRLVAEGKLHLAQAILEVQ
jgi:transcription initiation factor TFIID subunit 6